MNIIFYVLAVTIGLEWVIAGASAVVTIIGAILAVWNFTSKVKGTIVESTKKTIKEELEINNKTQNALLDSKLAHQSAMIAKDISAVGTNLDNFVKEQREENKVKDAQNRLTAHALIESYKRDIRDIYYNLRETGEITDTDKSYIDKIYPLYKDLGGNSDIGQKVAEINDVYNDVTRENYEKKRKNRKTKPASKPQEDKVEETTEEKGEE